MRNISSGYGVKYPKRAYNKVRELLAQEQGFGLLEVVLALALFGMFAASLTALSLGGFEGLERGAEQTQAQALATEGLEAVRAIRDRAWNENTFDESAIEISGSEWVFAGEGTDETIGQYTRTITYSDVCRDGSHEITTCPGTYTDVHTKLVTVTVSWEVFAGITNEVVRSSYITNWDSQEWADDLTADFSDGTFNETEGNGILGDADGAITLREL